MAAHNELGKWGEDKASEYLQQNGYQIIERDWKSGRRDIDIIATDGNEVIFVEVKTRRNSLYGAPEEAVDYHKLQSLRLAINHYIKYRRINSNIRFDIISVVGMIGQEPKIDHIKGVPLY
jgi:putative endonuclease